MGDQTCSRLRVSSRLVRPISRLTSRTPLAEPARPLHLLVLQRSVHQPSARDDDLKVVVLIVGHVYVVYRYYRDRYRLILRGLAGGERRRRDRVAVGVLVSKLTGWVCAVLVLAEHTARAGVLPYSSALGHWTGPSAGPRTVHDRRADMTLDAPRILAIFAILACLIAEHHARLLIGHRAGVRVRAPRV